MFAGMDNYEIAFWVTATVGTVFFVLKSLMMIVAGIDHDIDVDHDVHDMGHEGADGSDVAFKLFSINSITGFLMMFGWVGLSCYKQAELGPALSLLGAFAAGLAAMFITGWLFQAAKKLISPGDEFSIEDTIGVVASVYQEIPEGGSGRIQVCVNGLTREFDAVAEDGGGIASFMSVAVERVVNSTTVSVKISG